MARKRAQIKGRQDSGTFALLPHTVMDSEDFRMLSGNGMKVLLGLMRQFRGSNNGDLSAPFKMAKYWGINSKSTLSKALKELQKRRMITRTREGRFMKPGGCCALYALTWRTIDECGGKLEVSTTTSLNHTGFYGGHFV
ncbi:MAG: hypothetical protein V7693_04540 [Halopseudomonas sabulinigri]